jgi:hypothetical protein
VERAVVLVLGAFVLILGTGCAALQDSPVWPSYTREWCYPRISYKHERKKTTAGVACRW